MFTEIHIKTVNLPNSRCVRDYVDVYTQVKQADDDLLEIPLHGRYCGNDVDELPHLLISMNNIFIVGFFSDLDANSKGFLAEYRFIDACKQFGSCHSRPFVLVSL